MEIRIYKSPEKLDKHLKYWSNSLGGLHHHRKYDITENELPEELQKAYKIWPEDTGSLCYLVEYDHKYGIALINEFDETFAKTKNLPMRTIFKHMKQKTADLYLHHYGKFKNTAILLGQHSGFEGCHEFIVIFPWSIKKKDLQKAGEILFDTVYDIILN